MNLAARRAVILVIELVTFLMMTAFMTYFISHAEAPAFAPGSAPPANFPVIVYDGDRARPNARLYRVMPWGEWESYAVNRPGASLLLPQPAGNLQLSDEQQASFTVTDGSESRQTVELMWKIGSEERRSRYVAEARSAEPRSLHMITTRTFLLAALAGFGAGMLLGRLLRSRWLPRPGTIVPLPPQ